MVLYERKKNHSYSSLDEKPFNVRRDNAHPYFRNFAKSLPWLSKFHKKAVFLNPKATETAVPYRRKIKMPRTETKNTSEKHYVYILRCCDDSLYTDWTTDLKKRIETHNKGNGAKYTRARLPVKLVYFEEFADKLIAQSREREIKKLSKKQKEALVEKST